MLCLNFIIKWNVIFWYKNITMHQANNYFLGKFRPNGVFLTPYGNSIYFETLFIAYIQEKFTWHEIESNYVFDVYKDEVKPYA